MEPPVTSASPESQCTPWAQFSCAYPDKNPSLYSFEVTDFMFDFIEEKFEPPVESELINGRTIILEDEVT